MFFVTFNAFFFVFQNLSVKMTQNTVKFFCVLPDLLHLMLNYIQNFTVAAC